MSISCMIIDDEPLAGNLLEEYIQQIPYLRLEKKCITALEALGFLQQQPVELIFLDINLPKFSGMQLAQVLSKEQKVIFTTAYTEYAVESYQVNAVDYLLKPITLSRFIKAVEKASSLINRFPMPAPSMPAEESFFIKSGKSMVKLTYSEIYYIEGLKDYAIFYVKGEKYVVYKRMKELEESLPKYFMRIHNSFIVNMHHIHRIEDNHVFILQDRISIGEKYREIFMSAIRHKLF